MSEYKKVINDFVSKLKSTASQIASPEFIPTIKAGSDIVEPLRKTVIVSLMDGDIIDLEEFSTDLKSKVGRPSHPCGLYEIIHDLAAQRGDMSEKYGDSWRNFVHGVTTTKVKSVGLGEMAHPLIWENEVQPCPDSKGDVHVVDGDAMGYWDDKGKGANTPTMKGEGGKVRTQHEVFNREYGEGWEKIYSIRSKKKVENNFLPHVLEQDSAKLKRVLEELHKMPDESYALSDEDIREITATFQRAPEEYKRRENFLCLALLRRTCLTYGYAGYRFNGVYDNSERVSCLFLRPGSMPLEGLWSLAGELSDKGVNFKLVKTNKKSNYAYNDGCVAVKAKI